MLGLTPAQIRGYAAKGFLKPDRGPRGELLFGFHDLIILRTAGELSSAQIPQRKVRRVLEKLRDQLPVGTSLTSIRITADGDQVVVRDGDAMWNPESGQSLFDFSVADLAAKAEPIDRRKKDVDKELDADAWYDLACDLELSSPEEARTAYERAIELNPDLTDAHYNLAGILERRGDKPGALRHLKIYRKLKDAG